MLESTGPDGLMHGGVMKTTIKVRYKLGCLCAAGTWQGRQRQATAPTSKCILTAGTLALAVTGGTLYCDLIGFLLGDK